MSDYCRHCEYDVKQSTGPAACPLNALYWDFLARHERRFAANPRMAMPLQTLRKMDPAKRQALRESAAAFLAGPEMAATPG
jgi:deoxyribodipyrimidine photolyase-related protein